MKHEYTLSTLNRYDFSIINRVNSLKHISKAIQNLPIKWIINNIFFRRITFSVIRIIYMDDCDY